MIVLWHNDPILYYSHDITRPLNLLCMFVLNLCVDSWKCSSFGASIVCLSPHQVSRVSIILILLNPPPFQEGFIKSLFLINLLTTAEYSFLSLDSIIVILYLVGYSFTMFIRISKLFTRRIHWVALLVALLKNHLKPSVDCI